MHRRPPRVSDDDSDSTSPSNATFTLRKPGMRAGFTTMRSNAKCSTLCASPSVPMAPLPLFPTCPPEFAAPTIKVREGQHVYLTLTNVGMVMRPDLFDPHSVHWHGMPNAATVFDGLPESGIAINMNASLTYYYKIMEPGTYMYHCHVEATEHMQMGMPLECARPGVQHRSPARLAA